MIGALSARWSRLHYLPSLASGVLFEIRSEKLFKDSTAEMRPGEVLLPSEEPPLFVLNEVFSLPARFY
jgi:hypothetical protein